MQHPDEGTIHSWLDGALPAEEAASLESHVATCQSCAAAVAEARGFIAASSRILTALDDVPRGVLPAIPERKRDLRVFWRAAATVLVVAGGSLVVMREGGPDASVATSSEEPAIATAVSPAPPENTEPATASSSSVPQSDAAAVAQTSPPPSAASANRPPIAAEKDLSRTGERRQAAGNASGVVGGVERRTVAPVAAAPTSASSQTAGNVAALESNVTPLQIVRVDQAAGVRRTTYGITPTQTVVLTEPEPMQLSGAVAGSRTAAKPEIRLRGNSTSRVAAATAASAAPPMTDSRTGTDSAVARREAAAAKTEDGRAATGAAFATPANTISWTEATTGKTLTLSGNLPVEQLREIRLRIERERAAAATKIP